nr:helicase sen1 [Quercus suber]
MRRAGYSAAWSGCGSSSGDLLQDIFCCRRPSLEISPQWPLPHLRHSIMADTGAETVAKLEALLALGDQIHWFCPRVTAEDEDRFIDEDCLEILPSELAKEKEIRQSKIREAARRRDQVLEACVILAYDGAEAEPFKDKLKSGLQTQLQRCDVCVREYHRSHGLLKALLEGWYNEEDVEVFMQKFDDMNIQRITAGLNLLQGALMGLPEEKRSIVAAGDVGMYAMFEALNCTAFLCNEQLLETTFDPPFHAASTKKKIKLPNFVPGMTAFLYSHNTMRSTWAFNNFSKVKRELLGTEFEYSVQPFLVQAMGRVGVANLDLAFLPTFWKATRLILTKMTPALIKDNLRALDQNLYTIGLEHFQVKSGPFVDETASYQLLLELNPSAFWDAMGSISASTVLEQMLTAPALHEMLQLSVTREPLNLVEKMAWTLAFVRSIKADILVPPLRVLLDHLLIQFQKSPPYSSYTGTISWELGLACIIEAAGRLHKVYGPTVSNFVELVGTVHIPLIMEELRGIESKDDMRIDKTEHLGLAIIEKLLALDLASLAHDRYLILKDRDLENDINISGLSVWRHAMQAVKSGGPALPAAILAGTNALLPLEPFTARQVGYAEKQANAWNTALEKVLAYVHDDFLEALNMFNEEQLQDLYQDPHGARGLVTLLYNADESIHQGTVGILRILSGKDTRRDSIMHITSSFLGITLRSAAATHKHIWQSKMFGPCARFMKLGRDFFSCLTDSQDGILRSRTISEKQDLAALSDLWKETWNVLAIIFQHTEFWSNIGYDKAVMTEFCRATMEFAETVFDQYSIFASTLREGDKTKSDIEVGEELLKSPAKAFNNMTGWLRLRDDFLIETAVSLTVKVLRRLEEVSIQIDEKAALYVEGVIGSGTTTKIRTKLSPSQKAELQRALEQHLGEPVAEHIDINTTVPRKQSTLAGWAGKSSSSTPATAVARSKNVIDLEKWSTASDASKRKKDLADEHDKAYRDLIGSATSGQQAFRQKLPPKKPTPLVAPKVSQQQADFAAKRKAQEDEVKRKKAEFLAKQTGGKVGVGSGVQGLGNMGKDHTLKGQNVMVSSDEESDDDDDDELDTDLFGGPIKDKKKIQRPDVDPNGALGLKPEVKKGPTRIHRTARSAKDMRARLAPDLGPLHKIILQWDFFHEGDYPPGANPHIFRGVANSFTNPVSYQETFQPLLTLEAWQGMVKSREENTSKPYDIKINNRSNVDHFIELSTIVGQAENRDLQLQEGDIVLMSKAPKPHLDSSSPHCLSRVYRVKRQKNVLEIVYQTMSGTSLASSLTPNAVVHGVKVQTITPLEREYGALQGLQYYDLCNQICKAAPSKRINFSEKQIARFQDTYNVNRAQSQAINAALENEGFSLIQGPPGSGKTKTIVAIVGGLLSSVLGTSTSTSTGSRITVPGQKDVTIDAAPRKLLVCAPSNAAVDEIVMRLKDGVKTKDGRQHQISVVRIGRSDAINAQVQDVTIDELVARRMGNNTDDGTRQKNQQIFNEHKRVSDELNILMQKKNSGDVKGKEEGVLQQDIIAARKRKSELSAMIDNVKDKERDAGREAELNKKRAQQAVLNDAHVICATLSGSGHDMFRSLSIEFETVIIDEAAQCVEMSSLIPLKYGCVKCIMVGDPKQLPPTVFSKEAAKFQYEQSLFVRMQRNFADEVHLLDTQYRMHPDISIFPSRTFYDGLLKDGEGMAGLREKPWHKSSLLAPYRFYDVQGQHQAAPKGHSLINKAEISVAIALYERLGTDFKDYDFKGRIGIITPYKSQLKALKDSFSNRFGNTILDAVEFNTTDAFQGRESEVIIFSCVRASPAGGIGFLQDIRRMNVGLTRAKSSLWVLGNSESLARGQYWKKLVEDAQARDCYTSGDVIRMLAEGSNAYPASKPPSKLHAMHDTAPNPNGHHKNGDRKSSVVKSETPNNDAALQHLKREPSNPDAMQGVTRRYQDIRKTRPADNDHDVEMADAPASNEDDQMSSRDSDSTANIKPVASSRREGDLGTSAHSIKPPVSAHRANPPKPVPPPMIRKRPAPSVFINKKQR